MTRLAVWATVAVAALASIAIAVFLWINMQPKEPEAVPMPSVAPQSVTVDKTTGAIRIGNGSNTVDSYLDFMCPHCKAFEDVYGSTLESEAASGRATVNFYPVGALDQASNGTRFSTRAANLVYLTAEKKPDAVFDVIRGIFAQQPVQGSTGLDDEVLLEIAADAGVTGIDEQVKNVEYADFIAYVTTKIPPHPEDSNRYTPTVLVNGEYLMLTGDPQVDIIDRFAK